MQIVLPISLAAITFLVQADATFWNFDKDAAAQLPRGFSNDVGRWQVVVDATARSKRTMDQIGCANVFRRSEGVRSQIVTVAAVYDRRHSGI